MKESWFSSKNLYIFPYAKVVLNIEQMITSLRFTSYFTIRVYSYLYGLKAFKFLQPIKIQNCLINSVL